MNNRLLRCSFALAVLLSTNVAAQVTITPTVKPAPPGTLITVNNGPGDHSDPHVSGDLVSYSNSDGTNFTIRYFNLATRTDNGVPNSGTFDFLADVSGSTIAFTRVSASASAIFSFDTSAPNSPPVEIAPQAGSSRQSAQIGTTTIAWQEFGSAATSSDIVAYDRASRTTTPLGNPAALNAEPAISADGSVLAWESCASPTAPCDILSAVRTGTTWVTHQLTNVQVQGACSHPDTNGQVVVYACNRGSGDHLFWQPVTGGTEFALGFSGNQDWPSIFGQFVAFSGLGPVASSHDIDVLDLTTFNLYQISNTTGDNELNDISITAAGKVNVVWQVQQTSLAIYAFSFNLPNAALTNLGNLIAGFGLPAGTANSLLAKVNAALASLAAGNTTDACNELAALINEASAQSGKKLTAAEAAAIITAAQAIRTALGCP